MCHFIHVGVLVQILNLFRIFWEKRCHVFQHMRGNVKSIIVGVRL